MIAPIFPVASRTSAFLLGCHQLDEQYSTSLSPFCSRPILSVLRRATRKTRIRVRYYGGVLVALAAIALRGTPHPPVTILRGVMGRSLRTSQIKILSRWSDDLG